MTYHEVYQFIIHGWLAGTHPGPSGDGRGYFPLVFPGNVLSMTAATDFVKGGGGVPLDVLLGITFFLLSFRPGHILWRVSCGGQGEILYI